MGRILVLVAVLAVLGAGDHVMVKVPRLVGMDEYPARVLLAEKGFRVEVVRRPNASPVGMVCGQNPAPGVEVMEKYEVRLDVSTGPAPKE
jgi:beta-lactam-binding protein with PASTA domain